MVSRLPYIANSTKVLLLGTSRITWTYILRLALRRTASICARISDRSPSFLTSTANIRQVGCEILGALILTSLQREQWTIQREISQTSVTSLKPAADETSLIHELIAQYLAHDGYVETARAFAAEVREESHALATGGTSNAKDLEPEEDIDAVNRQSTYRCLREDLVSLTFPRNSGCNPRWRYRQGLEAHNCILSHGPPR